MDLDLRQVRAFVAAADHGHVGRAAATLFLTQQALSKRLARLEGHLGVLLERRPTGVALTPAGQRFLPVARHLLEVADHAAATARTPHAPPLRVDLWGRFGPLEAAVLAFTVDHPDAVVETGMRQNLPAALAAVRRNEIDIAFGNTTNLPDELPLDLSSTPAVLIPAVGLVSRDSELADSETVDAATLRSHGLVVPTSTHRREFAGWVLEYAESVGCTTVTDDRSSIMEGVVERVAADPHVVTLVPAAWTMPVDVGYVVVTIHPVPLFPVDAVWRTDSPHPLVPALLRTIRDTATPQPARHWLPTQARHRWS